MFFSIFSEHYQFLYIQGVVRMVIGDITISVMSCYYVE